MEQKKCLKFDGTSLSLNTIGWQNIFMIEIKSRNR